ncbi:ABC transporter permease [Candidatus Saccharibacteria bacterium]|nr:ABC transporter permease [Candidatus Saccharibacteria bacterium]
MALLFRTHLKLARTAIKENRTRSFLTCLGIAIGVASIILILSLTGSISRLITTEIGEMGANLIVVRPSTKKDTMTSIIEELTSYNSFEKSNLTTDDVAAISRINGITSAAPIAISTNTVSTDKNTLPSVTILGTNTDFLNVEPLTLRYGTFLSNDTSVGVGHTVVLGHTLSLALFNTVSSTIGKTITIMGEKFMVIGVLDEVNQSITFDNIDYDNTLIMDIGSLGHITGSTQIQQINAKAENTDSLPQLATDIQNALTNQKLGDQNFSVTYGDQITHPASSLFVIVSSVLTLVAGISLVVGGIGVMNIMLVSVSERNHEIGVRKAVGATSRAILAQFLLEALILSFFGGVLGLILGYALAFLISVITPFAPYISWQIVVATFLTTIIVGVIFGIYPAIKAASKNPIDSLKHYR